MTRERTSLAGRLLGLLVHNASELRFERGHEIAAAAVRGRRA
jgi:hypothetical protein